MAYDREKIQAELFELQDKKYRDFHSKLIPDIAKQNIIGIRTPVLRKYAKEFAKTDEAAAFLQDIPHTYYEENNLHMMLITSIKEYDKCLKEIEKFLPYIDNWATFCRAQRRTSATYQTMDSFERTVYDPLWDRNADASVSG